MPEEPNQFVVLEHKTQEDTHWDLMLQDGDVLITWRLSVPPYKIGSEPSQAQRINDHPLRFLTYEGPVQHNTGTVKRLEKGDCKWLTKKELLLAACLESKTLNGHLNLTKDQNKSNWSLVFKPLT